MSVNNDEKNTQNEGKLYKYIDIADRACRVFRISPKHLLIIQQTCKGITGKDYLTKEEGYLFLCISLFTSHSFLLPVFQTEEKIRKLATYLYEWLPSALRESLAPPTKGENGEDLQIDHAVTIYGFHVFRCTNSPNGFDIYEEKIIDRINFPFYQVITVFLRPLVNMELDDILEGRKPVTASARNQASNLTEIMSNAGFTRTAEKSKTFV